MCGRFLNRIPASETARLFRTTNPLPNYEPLYNIAPTNDVPVVRFRADAGTRSLDLLRWGLVPFWAKDMKIGASLINAAAETVAQKPAFREAFASRRCIVPADGFYEWQKLGPKEKQPFAIVMKDRSLFGFAGLWERWRDKASGAVVRSFTIITTTPNEVCAPIHNRMPVILDPASYGRWLGDEAVEPDQLLALLKPYPAALMAAYKVGQAVGNVKNIDASVADPLA
ncbi:MAG TPA: SOS response-associated peptidase [Stellaceae bacterium]|nr:SOS response-associated peptidase [Stellaceae bacterium]